jgi:hypothetical protein
MKDTSPSILLDWVALVMCLCFVRHYATRACLGSKIVVGPQGLLSAASLLKEMSQEGLPVIDSAHCIEKSVPCQKQ